jgi:hypothetical protein
MHWSATTHALECSCLRDTRHVWDRMRMQSVVSCQAVQHVLPNDGLCIASRQAQTAWLQTCLSAGLSLPEPALRGWIQWVCIYVEHATEPLLQHLIALLACPGMGVGQQDEQGGQALLAINNLYMGRYIGLGANAQGRMQMTCCFSCWPRKAQCITTPHLVRSQPMTLLCPCCCFPITCIGACTLSSALTVTTAPRKYSLRLW